MQAQALICDEKQNFSSQNVKLKDLGPGEVLFRSVLYLPDTDIPGFEVENRTKPREYALISANVKLMSAQKVAEVFMAGIIKKRYANLPDKAGIVWRVNRHFPWLVRWITDREYRQARRKLGKEPQGC